MHEAEERSPVSARGRQIAWCQSKRRPRTACRPAKERVRPEEILKSDRTAEWHEREVPLSSGLSQASRRTEEKTEELELPSYYFLQSRTRPEYRQPLPAFDANRRGGHVLPPACLF